MKPDAFHLKIWPHAFARGHHLLIEYRGKQLRQLLTEPPETFTNVEGDPEANLVAELLRHAIIALQEKRFGAAGETDSD